MSHTTSIHILSPLSQGPTSPSLLPHHHSLTWFENAMEVLYCRLIFRCAHLWLFYIYLYTTYGILFSFVDRSYFVSVSYHLISLSMIASSSILNFWGSSMPCLESMSNLYPYNIWQLPYTISYYPSQLYMIFLVLKLSENVCANTSLWFWFCISIIIKWRCWTYFVQQLVICFVLSEKFIEIVSYLLIKIFVIVKFFELFFLNINTLLDMYELLNLSFSILLENNFIWSEN